MIKILIIMDDEPWGIYNKLINARLLGKLFKEHNGKITISIVRDSKDVFVNCTPELISEVTTALDLDNFQFSVKK
jgi:hypothetical protein